MRVFLLLVPPDCAFFLSFIREWAFHPHLSVEERVQGVSLDHFQERSVHNNQWGTVRRACLPASCPRG